MPSAAAKPSQGELPPRELPQQLVWVTVSNYRLTRDRMYEFLVKTVGEDPQGERWSMEKTNELFSFKIPRTLSKDEVEELHRYRSNDGSLFAYTYLGKKDWRDYWVFPAADDPDQMPKLKEGVSAFDDDAVQSALGTS